MTDSQPEPRPTVAEMQRMVDEERARRRAEGKARNEAQSQGGGMSFQEMEQIVDRERWLRIYEQWVVEYLDKPHITQRRRDDITREISADNDGLNTAVDSLEKRGVIKKDLTDKYHLTKEADKLKT